MGGPREIRPDSCGTFGALGDKNQAEASGSWRQGEPLAAHKSCLTTRLPPPQLRHRLIAARCTVADSQAAINQRPRPSTARRLSLVNGRQDLRHQADGTSTSSQAPGAPPVATNRSCEHDYRLGLCATLFTNVWVLFSKR